MDRTLLDMDQEGKINWEKVLKHLDEHHEGALGTEELNQEELEMLLLAEETNMRLKRTNPENKFPVEAGWKELQARYKERNNKGNLVVRRSKRYWLMAAAAIFLGFIGSVWWLHFKPEVPGHNVSVAVVGIKLTLDNGETIALDAGKAPVLKSAGAALNGNTLVYQKETAMPEKNEDKISVNVLEVPYGKQTRVELSDGTVVWINSGSKISYPTRFSASKRELTLEGEAFFQVSHNAERPFVVHVRGLDVRVLGTEFNVNSFGSVVKTALVKGKVNLEAGGHFISLIPGELGSYGRENGVLQKMEADLKSYTAWKDGEIYFNNNSLSEIASRLEREYNIHFNFQDESLKNLHFTIDMPKTQGDVQKVLNNIRLSTNQVNFVVKGNVILVQHR